MIDIPLWAWIIGGLLIVIFFQYLKINDLRQEVESLKGSLKRAREASTKKKPQKRARWQGKGARA